MPHILQEYTTDTLTEKLLTLCFSHYDITSQMELYVKSNFTSSPCLKKNIAKGISQVQLNK